MKRINLVDFNLEKGEAEIGYRVGESCVGKGVASRGLELLLQKAVCDYGVSRLFAKTTSANVGSQ
ncbi:GNAT family N-acetyltransferase [Brevibacillus migulae]|uniref:GNAT family N-acetyltransferase n=1 Tax=Brevibacillus migulae TaxID=1644114 RepID=UPI00106E1EC9|nr:GNAT family N-acetyltransferase [Brevibacillus migulae]